MNLRKVRLTDSIRDLIASCFQGGQLEDPSLSNVTITSAKLSADLQVATVYFRVYDESRVEDALLGLGRASGFFKRKLAKHLKIRRVPELRFFYDKSIEHGARIEHLIKQLHA